MPAASEYNPTNKDVREAARAERAERQAWRARAWKYYGGDHPNPLKVRAGRPDNNVIINLVQQHADHTISFAAPDWPRLELDPAADTPQEERLAQFWEGAGKTTWLTNTMLAGLLVGHVFARLLPPNGEAALPRVVTLDPANVLAFWAEDDIEHLLWYEVYYRAGAMLRRQDIIRPGVLRDAEVTSDQWIIREWEQPAPRTDDQRIGEWTAIGQTTWPYKRGPIVDWQHLPWPGTYYGKHELAGLALNDAVNKVASDIKSILRVHASPRRVAIGVAPEAIKDTAIDSFWAIDGKTPSEVSIENLEMQSDLASSMAFMEFLTNAYMQQARTTILSGGPDAFRNITNLGIKAAFMAQIGKTETLHRQYGRGIARLSAAAQEMMGEPDEEPDVIWHGALPTSELEETQTQMMQVQGGLQSREGAANALGLDYKTVTQQIVNEAVIMDALLPGLPEGVS